MAPLTPQEFASCFDLTPGTDGPAAALLSESDYEGIMESLEEIENEERFWVEFSAVYLPSLFRTLREGFKLAKFNPNASPVARQREDLKGLESYIVLLPMAAWLINARSSQSWNWFMRDHPTEVRNLFWEMLESWARIPLGVAKKPVVLDRIFQPLAVVLAYLTVVFCAYPHLEKKDLPTLSSETKRGLALRLPLLQPRDRRFSAGDGGVVVALQKLPSMGWDVARWAGNFQPWRWGTCIFEGSTPMDAGPCEVGSDVQTCSRCFSVHYCSHAHQVYDWPNHKRICVPAGW